MKNNRRRYSDLYPSCFLKKALFLTALFFLTNTVSATTYYADVDRANDSGDGASWATAKKTLQAAVDLASDGDTVLVADGTYEAGGLWDAAEKGISSIVTIHKPITVRSVSGSEYTTISGLEDYTCVSMSSDSVLSGFRVQDGDPGVDLSGGARMEHCVVSGNEGGGVEMQDDAVVTECWISGNSGQWSYGVEMQGSALLADCVVSNNHVSGSGAGISMEGACRVERCTVVHNSSSGFGGGIYMLGWAWAGGESGTVKDCHVNNNSAVNGGGVYIEGGGTLLNTFVHSNHASTNGGGVCLLENGSVNACIVSNNSAIQGGGVNASQQFDFGEMHLEGCVVLDNRAAAGGRRRCVP